MGNVAEPSTNTMRYDVYTGLTYADVDEHNEQDPYHQESIINLKQGDSIIYDQHFLFLDSLLVQSKTDGSRQLMP